MVKTHEHKEGTTDTVVYLTPGRVGGGRGAEKKITIGYLDDEIICTTNPHDLTLINLHSYPQT